jgi:DNA-binding transcriptional MerR regulator
VGRQAIDILGWELYNKAQSATTQDMDASVGESPWWRRVLKKAIREDLRAGIDKPLLNEVTKEELSAVRYFTQGQPYEVEKLLIQLLDRYGLSLEDVEQLAAEIGGMAPADINQEPAVMQQIKEELQAYLKEVYSKKQRDFMCAMKDAPEGDRPESLSQSEAEHLCSAPMEKPKKRKTK